MVSNLNSDHPFKLFYHSYHRFILFLCKSHSRYFLLYRTQSNLIKLSIYANFAFALYIYIEIYSVYKFYYMMHDAKFAPNDSRFFNPESS